MDYDTLRQDFPETISMEQFYKMAHISKRTCRFQIRLTDAIAFLERQAAGELEGVIPAGAFTSGAVREVPSQAYLDSEELTAYLLTHWHDAPDMLTVKQAVALCGYAPTSINHWVQNKRIDAVLYFGNNLVSKDSLALFLASPYGQSIAVQSAWHKELIADFCEEMQNSDMTFGVMSL